MLLIHGLKFVGSLEAFFYTGLRRELEVYFSYSRGGGSIFSHLW